MCDPCSYCDGNGTVKSATTVCYEVLRETNKIAKKSAGNKISIFTHPEVSSRLTGEDAGMLETIEELYSKNIVVRAENSYHVEQYEIFTNDP